MRRLLLAAFALLAGAGGCGSEDSLPAVPTVEDAPSAIFRPADIHVGSALLAEPLATNAEYRRAFLRTFTSATPENAMKWEIVHPEPDEWDFERADAIVSFADEHDRRVRGHPLVWDLQLPQWVREAPTDQLRGILREHVQRLARRYRGRVEAWDVVNEPLEPDGSLTRNLWYRAMGEDYIALAFRWAQQADPDARLFLNEIAAEHPGPKARGLVRLVRELVEQGVPIDGVGLQNHTTAADAPDAERLQTLMEAFGELGLATEITEMDVVVGRGAGREALSRQAEAYADAAEACRAVRRCAGVTVWGVGDAFSWKGADKQPLLLDADLEPKPALAALRETLPSERGQ